VINDRIEDVFRHRPHATIASHINGMIDASFVPASG
jgi:hypothetical protein